MFAPTEPAPRPIVPPGTVQPIPTPPLTVGKKKSWGFSFLGAVQMLIGVGMFIYGMSQPASNIYQQIYLAIYIFGGAVVCGVAAILLALTTD